MTGTGFLTKLDQWADAILAQWVRDGHVDTYQRDFPENRRKAESAARACMGIR